jgi:hypothetical protein
LRAEREGGREGEREREQIDPRWSFERRRSYVRHTRREYNLHRFSLSLSLCVCVCLFDITQCQNHYYILKKNTSWAFWSRRSC